MSSFNDRWKLLFGVILIGTYIIGIKSQNRGFLLTAPNTLHANTYETMCISFHNLFANGSISVELVTNNLKIASTSTTIIEGKHSCFEMLLPKTTSTSGILKVNGNFGSLSYKFHGEATVTISSNSVMTFIETDKKVYKHGQKVLFRIFRLTNKFLPVLDPIPEVWIENPLGVRLVQWKNSTIENGLTDLSFELSDEPPLGEWSICLENTPGIKEKQTFLIQEYVLPKFEITLDTPSVILANYESFSLKVCARYTYGRPVHGMVNIEARIDATDAMNAIAFSPFVLNNVSFNLKHGCHEVELFKHNFTNTQPMTNRFSILDIYEEVYSISITFFAEVIEYGTELKINKSKSQTIFKERLQFEIKSKPYFKPNMTYFGKILVQHRNGNPAVNEELFLNVRNNDKIYFKENLTSNHLGEVDFVFEPKFENQEYKISLKGLPGSGKLKTSFIHTPVKSWYSPTQSYLQMGQVNGKLGCARDHFDLLVNFTVSESVITEEITFYYQIMARGRMLTNQNKTYIYKNLEQIKKGSDGIIIESITLPINFSPQMSPLAYILVYYVRRKDNEIVSDSQKITMENCFENNVTVSFDKDEILPATTSVIDILAHPQSICAISVVDKSAHLLASEDFLNIEKVFSVTSKTYPIKVTAPNKKHSCHHRCSRYHKYVENGRAFNDAGLVTISNLDFKYPPCPSCMAFNAWPRSGGRSRPIYFSDVMARQTEPKISPPRKTVSNTDESPIVVDQSTPKEIKSPVEIRDYFPETWLWELHHVGSNGSLQLKREIPHSITTWIGTAFCLSEKKGLGISQPASVRGFQAFFLSYTMPYSIKNEEIAPVIVTIFNYVSECIPVRIFIESSDKFTLVSNFSSTHVCLCDLPHTHKFWIRPTFIGTINVTVYAHSVEKNISKICKNETKFANVIASDAATNQIIVKAQGFPRELSNTSWICRRGHLKNAFRQEFDLFLPRDVIAGSERAYVNIIGDLMGPTVHGLESLVRLPVGCGEQNMILFAPNIYVLQYLTNSHQLTDDLKAKTIEHLRTGYQRELNYKHDDGSYSAFGKTDSSGSIWLTAFVLKSFAQAIPFVYIDLKELQNSEAFIFKNQLPNGSFNATGRVLQKEMQGGVGSETSDQSLAAYILIALLEAGSELNSTRVNKAFNFLSSHDSKADNTHLLAMKAYAATLAKRNASASLYIKQLNQRATREGNLLYWTQGNDSHAMTIEITSYVLLTLVTQNDENSKGDALSIVRWLTKQRNAYGGFVSTQDTILALQAMAKYAGLVKFANVSLEIKLDSLDMENIKLAVNNENKLVQQTRKIPVLPTHLDVEVTGKGCAMVQYTMKYNVLNNGPTDAFILDVSISSVPKTCSEKQLHICTSYKLADGRSNMAVIEVQMISGFEADTDSLDVLQNSIDVQLKRWEVSPEGYINLYFDELTRVKKCFNFNVIEKFVVHERQPAIVKAYDYYDPDLTVSATYSLPVEDICNGVLDSNGTIY